MVNEVDTGRLAEHLKALANPNRLELLLRLRTPCAVADIELRPAAVQPGENPERAISHQAVREHLAKLRDLGVVTVKRTEREGAVVDAYVLDHRMLFAIVEELRSLGELRADEAPAPEATLPGTPGARPQAWNGPRFVLVRGQGEGRVFPLKRELMAAERGWVVGRRAGLAVSLDYDPFVSGENAEVVPEADGFRVLDLRSSRNGTRVNFVPLPRGGSAPLRDGDVVSVGRTNLVFRVR